MRRLCLTVCPAASLIFACCGSSDPSIADTDKESSTGLESSGGARTPDDDSTTVQDDETTQQAADSTGEETAGPPPGLFLDGFFPLGVFAQPEENFEFWVDRGCNTMLDVPQGESAATWDAAAQSYGLKVIRRPLSNAASDIGRTDLLAWSLPDEPDAEANNVPCGGSCVELCEAMHDAWRDLDPDRKIFVNLAGPNVLLSASCDYCNGPGDQPPVASCYPNNDQCYPRLLDTADWISQDIYPFAGWLPTEQLRDDVNVVGQTLDRIRTWTDKPLFAIIETSDQRLGFEGTGARGPTAAEYRAQVWGAIIHGARGIFYFPQAFNPFEWDLTPAGVLEEMERQHALITTLAPVLQGEINPSGVTVTVPAPMEAGWRESAEGTYVFVLNASANTLAGAPIEVSGLATEVEADVLGESRSATITQGDLTDDFAPYELHIYVLPT